METWGSFAYYFNIFASKSFISSGYFSVPICVFLLIGAVLSVLSSQLLVHTIDLHYGAGEHGEELLDRPEGEQTRRPQEERGNSVTLPALLYLSAPRTVLGDVLYFVFLMLTVVVTLRITIFWSQLLFYLVSEFSLVLFAPCLAGVLLAPFLPLRYMSWLQLLCVLLNLCAMSCNQFGGRLGREWLLLMLPVFVLFFSNLLMIPTVMTGLNVSSKLQNEVQLVAVGVAGALYFFLGLLNSLFWGSYCSYYAERLLELWFILCAYANIQIGIRVLTEIVVAWRYGQNLQMAQLYYPIRIKLVQILLPCVIILACFFFELGNEKIRNMLLGCMLGAGFQLIMVAYCYQCTVRIVGRDYEHKAEMYVVYLGGFISLAATVMCYFHYYDQQMWISLMLDGVLVTFVVSWQAIGHFFS